MKSDKKTTSLEKTPHAGPNMTPMVDVVMCILIFFMLASAFVSPELVLANTMPAIEKGEGQVRVNAPPPPVRLTLTLVRRGDVTWLGASDGSLLPIGKTDAEKSGGAISDFLHAKRDALSESAQVIIAPHQDVPYQDVVTVYDDCLGARFSHVAFAPARPGE